MNQAVADEGNRKRRGTENDDAQASAAWCRGLKTYADRGPGAAQTEPPALLLSLNVFDLREHRVRPVQSIRRQAAYCEGEQPLSPIVLGVAAESTHGRGHTER
jgi:hypothetical protein